MKNFLEDLWLDWNEFWFEPISPSSICVFRIAFGLLSLVNALLYLPDFGAWFSPDGPLPMGAVHNLRGMAVTSLLLKLDWSEGTYWLLMMVEILTSITVTLGFFTRTSTVVLWLTRLVLFQRNPVLWHQVDILLRIYGLALIVCPAGEMYSIDSLLRRKADPLAPRRLFAPWGQRLIQVKICLVYAEAFLGKIVAPAWLDGSAVYYATHFPDGWRRPIPPFMDHIWVYKSLTYFTLGIEFALLALVWIRPLRYPVLIGGALFHLGIHVFINLDLLEFGAMIAFICYIYPEDTERWMGRLFGGKPVPRGNP